MKHQFEQLDSSWKEVLKAEFKADYFLHLIDFLEQEVENQQTIYPEPSKIYAAFQAIPFEKVKVVLIGQDPYHGSGQANGLSFSVKDGIRKPPSLVNIFKEGTSQEKARIIALLGELDPTNNSKYQKINQ
jgi:uracil-DNA glycosylase